MPLISFLLVAKRGPFKNQPSPSQKNNESRQDGRRHAADVHPAERLQRSAQERRATERRLRRAVVDRVELFSSRCWKRVLG